LASAVAGTAEVVITLVILFVLVALAIAFALALGLGPLAIIPAVVAVGVAIWLLAGLARGDTPSRAARRTERPELLGPGGPDDPDAT
jgi:hypothetical protein